MQFWKQKGKSCAFNVQSIYLTWIYSDFDSIWTHQNCLEGTYNVLECLKKGWTGPAFSVIVSVLSHGDFRNVLWWNEVILGKLFAVLIGFYFFLLDLWFIWVSISKFSCDLPRWDIGTSPSLLLVLPSSFQTAWLSLLECGFWIIFLCHLSTILIFL